MNETPGIVDGLVGLTVAKLTKTLGGAPSTEVDRLGDDDLIVLKLENMTEEHEALVANYNLDVVEAGKRGLFVFLRLFCFSEEDHRPT